MKRFICSTLAIAAVLLMSAASGQAGHHGGGHGWGPVIGLGLGLGILGLTYPYYGPQYYPAYAPAPVYEGPPAEMYMQPVPQQSAAPEFWYYCREPEGYHPYVQQCPGGWMKVVPEPPER